MMINIECSDINSTSSAAFDKAVLTITNYLIKVKLIQVSAMKNI